MDIASLGLDVEERRSEWAVRGSSSSMGSNSGGTS